MTDITRSNLKELHEMVKHELGMRGYTCDALEKKDGFSGSYLVCKPFRDPGVKRAYEISIPTIFEDNKYVVGEAKKKIRLVRCANETCICGRVMETYNIRNPEKLTQRIADDIEINFVVPDWMKR